MSKAVPLYSLCVAVLLVAASCSAEPEIAINNASSSQASESDTSTRDAGDNSTAQTGFTGCNYLGTDSWNDMQIEVAFENEESNVTDIRVTYSVITNGGEVIHDGSRTIDRVAPNEALRWHIDTLTEPTASDNGYECRIDSITARESTESTVLPTAGDSCRFVELDAFEDIQIEIQFTAPSDGSLDVTYAVRSGDGTRFAGGDAAPAAATAAGDVVTLNEDTVADVPEWLTGDISCEILGITES